MPLGRSWSLIARNAFNAANWRALARAPSIYVHPAASTRRYLTASGRYPWRCEVRTPRGRVAPVLFSYHDLLTMNEVFCREDYRARRDVNVIVDIGSNIGLSAMYFLSRNGASRVRCYEPVPRNVARLQENLRPFDGRWSVEEVAVDADSGQAMFGDEPTGRYGAIGLQGALHTFPVRVRGINDLLDDVLDEFGQIDVLKIDTEGAELRTVGAIRTEHLARIDTIYFEWMGEVDLPQPALLRIARRCDTITVRKR